MQILDDLKHLSADQLPGVAEFLHNQRLHRPEMLDRARHFERYSGVITDEEAERMLAVIEAECEQIDPNGW
jgi:hypothetical protein